MKKKIFALLLILTLIISAVCLAACDKGPTPTFVNNYAAAEKNWDNAHAKKSADTATIDLTLGSGDSAMTAEVTLEGTRTYVGDSFKMEYKVKLKAVAGLVNIGLKLVVTGDKDNITLAISEGTGIFTIPDTSISIATSVVKTYVPSFDFAKNNYYDTETIAHTGNSEGADTYTVTGDKSLAYVIWQIAPILSNNFNVDMLSRLEKWLSFGDVSGEVSFDGGNFATMTSTQDIAISAPWEEVEYLMYNVDNFPRMLAEIINTKKISINDSLSFDLKAMMPDALTLSATVTTGGTFTILPDDTTL